MMMFLNTVRLAMRSIFSNKMRSFLTMLGIIIGVMSVVLLMSIAQSATGSITGAISSMGSEIMTCSITDEDVSIAEEDLVPLDECADIVAWTPYLSVNGTARSGKNTVTASGIGAKSNYMDVQGLSLQAGRGIVPSDEEWRTSVAVIGTEIAGKLYESYDVIGKTFTFSNKMFTIVGLLEKSGTSLAGSLDSRILIPLSTAQHLTDKTDVSTFYVKATSSETVDAAQRYTEALLYNLTGDEDTYSVFNMSQLLDTLDDVMSTLSLLFGGIAAISLLVGGIGIMNIMLVSVAERTREIGIRKAIGARRGHIMMQFLIEACVLSIFGGVIGIGVSALGLKIYSMIADMEVQMYSVACAASLVFCIVIGVVFGGYPANKASKMTPIDALQRR